ncbi:HAD family hydrolase [Pseudoalteromonas tunicata]|uniref:HAD family hydrolase n=1 Tax=Pseudoalteromonas tunicata TaxID=314281 RepID=UPI00273D6373|nr:HAD family phosphatase [Pseudoalteromonas tunicata]MDP4984417.1 HAD family phosphatase [Pseudoalteromonas tunicata]
MLKAVLFDCDGTLVDSESLHYQCWQHILVPYNIAYDEGHFCHLFSGKPTLEAAQFIIDEHGLTVDAKALAGQKNDYFADYVQNHLPPLLPYAKEVLSLAKQSSLQVALVTGSARAEVMPILAGYQLLDYFEVIVTKDDVTQPKPHPEPYLSALKQLGQAAQFGVAIEDTCTGLTSAKGAGLLAIAVPNDHSQHQDLSLADHTCTNLMQAWQRIELAQS